MNAAAKFLADDGMRTLPIACRLVPLDQWLVTHVDTSWKVKDIKQWILSKCNIWGSAGAPQPPRFRPPSPVTFSSFSRRSSLDSVSWAGTEEGAEDDWDAFAAVDYNAELRASDAALASSSAKTPLESEAPDFYISPQPQPRSSTEREFDATSAQFTLVSFSNGFILEDDAYLSWYKPRPFELFEVHRAGAIVSLPRSGISYAEPYFESAVRVSERPHNKRSARTSEDQQAHSIEWKPRWAIVRDGVLHLCKEAHLPPTHRFPLSALCALYGPEQFGLGMNASSQIICAKFDRMSMSGSIVSRELDDINSPPSQGRKNLKTTSWVLLDMPSRSSYENLLRILHRLAPHPLSSSFIPSRAPAALPISPTSPRHRSRSSVILPSPIDSERSYDSSASTFFGVQYPEWRLALLQRCRMAGRGAVGSALSLAQAHCLIATAGTCELPHHPLPRASSISEGLRRRAEQIFTSGTSEDEDVSKRSDVSGVHPWKEALSEGDDEDDEDDDVESEVEWEGWFRDLARRPTRPPPFSTHGNRSKAVSPSSPSSSEADYDYMEVGGLARVRTLSTAPNPSKPTLPQRSRSSTISTAGTVFGSTYTTTTTITTYVDRVPDLRAPSASSSPPTWTQQSFAGTMPMPMPPSPSSSSPRNTPRTRRVHAAAGSPVTGVPMRMTPPQSISGPASRAPSVSGSEMSSSVGDGSGGSGRNSGIGGVKRIVRGVSIRNAFSAERFVRGFENALDFVDGR
ncbi:hypothetical protein ACEPAF_2934 [Sanghuangporus sanghuang]